MEKKIKDSDLIVLSSLIIINPKEIECINYYYDKSRLGLERCYEIGFKSGGKINGICRGSLAFENLDKLISKLYVKQRD